MELAIGAALVLAHQALDALEAVVRAVATGS